eukprot:EG_transcript_39943
MASDLYSDEKSDMATEEVEARSRETLFDQSSLEQQVRSSPGPPHCTVFSRSSPAISFIASTVWNIAILSASLPACVTLTSTTASPRAVPAIFTDSRKRPQRLPHVSSERKKGIERTGRKK